jgi:hypothetical protein
MHVPKRNRRIATMDRIIHWDGSRVPDELRDLPPGSYAIASIGEPEPLTGEQDAGIREALDELDAGRGIALVDIVREIRRGPSGK